MRLELRGGVAVSQVQDAVGSGEVTDGISCGNGLRQAPDNLRVVLSLRARVPAQERTTCLLPPACRRRLGLLSEVGAVRSKGLEAHLQPVGVHEGHEATG